MSADLEVQLEILRRELQVAIEVELSTIPPYLSALYSIRAEANPQAQANLRNVVMEEMLHMTLAANVLNAVGGHPQIGRRGFVPGYPSDLPWHAPGFQVGLAAFSAAQVECFCAIEAPDPRHPLLARLTLLDPARVAQAQAGCSKEPPPEPKNYQTLGAFYAALIERLHWLVCRFSPASIFTGDRSLQVRPDAYYGADGPIIVVHDLETAVSALREIVLQGEGTHTSVWDGSHEEAVPPAPAHYYQFDEIRRGRRYRAGDQPDHPTGASFDVDWAAVHPMSANPKRQAYERAHPEIYERLKRFDDLYLAVLDQVNTAFNGEPDQLRRAVARMYELRYAATELMCVPDPLQPGHTVGASFGSMAPRSSARDAGWWRGERAA